jgi:hypothetical protein
MIGMPAPVTRTIVLTRRDEPLAGLLLHGHTLIDSGKYPDALYFYRRLVDFFERWIPPGPRDSPAARPETGAPPAERR